MPNNCTMRPIDELGQIGNLNTAIELEGVFKNHGVAVWYHDGAPWAGLMHNRLVIAEDLIHISSDHLTMINEKLLLQPRMYQSTQYETRG